MSRENVIRVSRLIVNRATDNHGQRIAISYISPSKLFKSSAGINF